MAGQTGVSNQPVRNFASTLKGVAKSLVGPGVLRYRRGRIAKSCDGVLTPLSRVESTRGLIVSLPVRISNRSRKIWGGPEGLPVQVLFEWFGRSGGILPDAPKEAVNLPHGVAPGETVEVDIPFRMLRALGRFEVRAGLGLGFEHRLPVAPASMEVVVDSAQTEDIDYHKHFASFDLDKDYWTVVGPTTEAEFQRLAGVKRELLVGIGLTPDSRVLDVGTGTGQLAAGLVDYLSDRGAFWGTELALPGVEFCRRKYTRPNFHFLQNDMTDIPIRGEKFDFITYFSVFTHTYPDENRELLRQSRDLLAPGGCIFADFFTSPHVDTHLGTRAATENNHERLLAMIADLGLKAEEESCQPWQEYASRRFLKLTRL